MDFSPSIRSKDVIRMEIRSKTLMFQGGQKTRVKSVSMCFERFKTALIFKEVYFKIRIVVEVTGTFLSL